MNVKSNKSGILHQARLLCVRLCAANRRNPRTVHIG